MTVLLSAESTTFVVLAGLLSDFCVHSKLFASMSLNERVTPFIPWTGFSLPSSVTTVTVWFVSPCALTLSTVMRTSVPTFSIVVTLVAGGTGGGPGS